MVKLVNFKLKALLFLRTGRLNVFVPDYRRGIENNKKLHTRSFSFFLVRGLLGFALKSNPAAEILRAKLYQFFVM